MEKGCLILLAALLSSVVVCPSSQTLSAVRASSAQERDYWPTSGWLRSEPEEQGMNSTTLNHMMDFVRNQNMLINGIVIVRDGYVVLEEYPRSPLYDGTRPHPLYSVTKSFTSALMGIALKEGFINSVEDKVLDFFPGRTFANMSLWKQTVTIKHLLTMTSGLPWDESSYPYDDSRNDVRRLTGSSDPVQFLLDRAMVSEPGAQWDYNSGGSHLLMEIVNQTACINPLEYAREHLFDLLGITNMQWGTSGQGIPWGFYDLHLTPLDMAKFGYLYLNNGTWDGVQILTQEWVARSTESHIMLYGDTGYGYQWWITDQPRGIYDARGMGGQRIIVIPEYDMVVVFVSSGTGAQEEDELLYDFILAAVTDAPPIGEFSSATAYALCLAGLSFTIAVLHRFGRKP